MTAEEPLNLKCSTAGSTTTVIRAANKRNFVLFVMNKSDKIV